MDKFCTLFLHGNQGLSESSWGEAGHGGTQSPASSPPVSNSFPTRSHMPKDRRGEATVVQKGDNEYSGVRISDANGGRSVFLWNL